MSPTHARAIAETCSLVLFGMTVAAVLDMEPTMPRDLDVLEVFTLAKTIEEAATSRNFKAETFDFMNPGQENVRTETGFWQLLNLLLRVKEDGLVTLAPDCRSFVFAPSSKTKRTKQNYDGDARCPAVRSGNVIARIAFFMYVLALARGAQVCLENPSGSMIFSFLRSQIDSLAGLQSPVFYIVPRCAYVLQRPTFLKKYKFMTSGTWFAQCARQCCCAVPHERLMDVVELEDGTVQVNGNGHLKQSGLYPAALGEAILLAWMKAFQKTTDPKLLAPVHAVPSPKPVHAVPSPADPAAAAPRAAMDSADDADDDPWADNNPEHPPAKPSKKKRCKKVTKRPAAKVRAKVTKAKKVASQAACRDDDSDPWG